MSERVIDIGFYATLVVIVLVSLPLWRRLIQAFGRRPLLETRQPLPCPLGLVDVGFFVIAWALVQLLVISLMVQILDINPEAIEQLDGRKLGLVMTAVATVQLLATAFGLWYVYSRYQSTRALGWQPEAFKADLKLSLAAFVLVAPLTLLVQFLLSMLVDYDHPVLDTMIKNANVLTIAATWFTAVFAAPITEEVFFRGVLQGWLQRLNYQTPLAMSRSMLGGWDEHAEAAFDRFGNELSANSSAADDGNPYRPTLSEKNGPDIEMTSSEVVHWRPILISSMLFALAHSGQGLAPVPLFGFSIALGYLFQKTGSLVPSIGAHMLLNGFSVFWLTVKVMFVSSG